MLSFIWNSWWRHKERFLLLIVGVLIISTGLSYLIGITQANNGTVVNELQNRWKSSYHIVVRPPGSRSVTEDLNLLEPNYLSGLEAGITLQQYEQIKKIENVEIAAPIAMIGSNTQYVELEDPNIKEPGIYRMIHKYETNTGLKTEVTEYNWYVSAGAWQPATAEDYGVSPGIPTLSYGSNVMIAGIDPEAEAALVGLDNAMIKNELSRYFNEQDVAFTTTAFEDIQDYHIPVIVSTQLFTDEKVTYSFEKLDIPFDENRQKVAEEIKEKGGSDYLDTLKGTPIKEFTYTTTEVHKRLVKNILDESTDDLISKPDFAWIALKPSPVKYSPISSPYSERWPFAYQVEPYELIENSPWKTKHMYRQFNPYGEDSREWLRLRLNYIGVFDPQKLAISKDPLTELPMETYFPAKAEFVMDSENNPVNPPVTMKPTNDSFGLLTKPPLLLTTLEAASKVLGDKPISAIRVNVAGVESFNEESEKLLQKVASEIEKETGLITDITLGSSPQYAITHLPGLDGEKAVGWVQQPWIKIGSSVSIFNEVKVGSSVVIFSVILVAMVYVFSSNLIMMFARKKEFALLLSLGWRPSQLSKLLMLEATVLGLAVTFISWMILGLFVSNSQVDTSIVRILLVGIAGLAIYWLGSLIPVLIVRRIKPYETMSTGEISKQTRSFFKANSVIGVSFKYFFNQWKRSLLSISTIAIPTSLFIVFIFITFQLKGVMYATWLGQFVALEVSGMHFVAMGVALLIAILTSTEIMWQNVAERQAQIAVLKAIGWRTSRIRMLVLSEGAISGGLAGLLGLGIALIMITTIYGRFPVEEIVLIIATITVPILAGIVGAILPAEKSARVQPYQGIYGGYSNSKKTERQFKMFFGLVGSAVFTGLLLLLNLSIPEMEQSNLQSHNEPEGKTEGEVKETTGTLSQPNDSEEDKGLVVVDRPAKGQEFASRADYNLDVEMIKTNEFKISAEIQVSNQSQNEWSDIGFYFIPNVLTEEYSLDYVEVPEKTSILSITESGKELTYSLDNNRLVVNLNQNLKPGEKKQVKIEYTLSLPENEVRLSKVDNNYYMAQWYPMLGNYNGGWLIEDFDRKGESYHTNYGNYTVTYTLSEPYLVASSGLEGVITPTSQGKITGENIKDFYLAFLDPESWIYQTANVEDTVIRAFIPKDSIAIDRFLQTATDAFQFFEEHIGSHPSKEIDIIGNEGAMEYPNIVEVSVQEKSFEHTLAHELAHQWFYYLVSNDPYHEAWLDEGITEFATSLYLSEKYGNDVRGFEFASTIFNANKPNAFVNIPLSEFDNNYYSTVYGKVPIKLKGFFDRQGGHEEALNFLANYYEEFQFENVTTEDFSNFFLKRYGQNEKEYLRGWLKISE